MHICKSMVHFFDETERKSANFNWKRENGRGVSGIFTISHFHTSVWVDKISIII